ncbi:hypothetical protein JG687_00011323 [Phytophthora cactorum]|uniref:Uncharacterized protein n=1 Tax=Phytophthora cactorum TaxID=29920 RepID=A0A8T1U678_9STRA|nr:hypothetical protein JG687_00011323 [Phytophthora cactorum]
MLLNPDISHPSSHYPRVSRHSYSALLGVISGVACTTTKKSMAAGANTILKVYDASGSNSTLTYYTG